MPTSLNLRARNETTRSRHLRQLRCLLVGLSLAVVATGSSALQDCDAFGNKVDARIRSSKVRMILENPAAAYARFAPYAAMSALVYEEAPECNHKLPPVEHKEFLLAALKQGGWRQDNSTPSLPKCDDDIGTFFRVWMKEQIDHNEIVIVFRGTKGGLQDWINGNLRWITRVIPGDDQYERSREHAGVILKYYKDGLGKIANGKPIRFYSAGHSLGGGLAQNVLYQYPIDFKQAYAFDPSPVTGYADNKSSEKKSRCDCLFSELSGEARVYRIYETDEVLAWLRFPLKLVLPLNRHIQEVRFNFDVGHSMASLAMGMIEGVAGSPLGTRTQWWKGRDSKDGDNCTALYQEGLEESCTESNSEQNCPR